MLATTLALVTAPAACAAGLGPLKVTSVLGQPFAAEAELQGLSDDDMLTAQSRIASREEYERAGLPAGALAYQLRASIDDQGKGGKGKRLVRIASSAPINEPAFTVMVEFTWRGGRIVQRFPVLLDPPRN
jgi:pilus assembly protein FimV